MKKPPSINQPPRQVAIGVDAAVAQERPVRARDVNLREIDGDGENLLLIGARLAENLAAGAGHEALSPELEAIAADGAFVADAVGHGHVAAVGHGVRSLDDFPRSVLIHAVFLLLPGMPADGGGVEKNL